MSPPVVQTDAGDVVVAVVDTGIDFIDPDLPANLYTDANGLHGYTCINGPCTGGGQDDHGHGTHVAGTVGAAADKGFGMADLNWRVSVRGGAAEGSTRVTVVRSPLATPAPTGTLPLSPSHVNVGDTVTVSFPITSTAPAA